MSAPVRVCLVEPSLDVLAGTGYRKCIERRADGSNIRQLVSSYRQLAAAR